MGRISSDKNPSLASDGRVAVVTGSSRGIGLAIARALAAEGCRVMLCARGKAALTRATDTLTHRGYAVQAVVADLATPAGIRRLVTQTLRRFERIDLWVNNVGGPLYRRPLSEIDDAAWRRTLEVNFFSAVRACRAVVPIMRRQKGGRIINIASTAGLDVEVRFPDYGVAKAALIAFGRALAQELAADGILVNTVCPGAVWTSSWDREAAKNARRTGQSVQEARDALRAAVASRIPTGRMGTPEEVAGLVAFLAGSASSWTTGAVFRIDGGWSNGPPPGS